MDVPSPLEGLPSVQIGPFAIGIHEADIRDYVGRLPVVSSDDNYLSHGGGVSEAIWQAAGPLTHSTRTHDVLDGVKHLGLSDVTTSRTVSGELVLHGITIDFDSGERLTARTAQALYGRILDTVADSGLAAVVMPLLGTGVAGVAPVESLAALVAAVRDRSVLPFGVDVLLLSEDVDFEALTEIAEGGATSRSRQRSQKIIDWLDADGVVGGGIAASPPASSTGYGRDAFELRRDSDALRRSRGPDGPMEFTRIEPDSRTRPQSPGPSLRGEGRPVGSSLAGLAAAGGHTPEVQQAASSVDAADSREETEDAALGLWGALVKNPDAMLKEHQSESWFIRAQAARNQLSHGMSKRRDPGLVRDLLRGCRVLLLEDIGGSAASVELEQQLVEPIVVDSDEARGTSHVRRLHDLLMASLSETEKAREHQRLRDLGYRGDLNNCILESCVAEDPVDLLVRHFSGHDLAQFLVDRQAKVPPAEPIVGLAERLLRALGFPRHGVLIDPSKVAQELKTFGSEIHNMNADQLLGRVTKVSRSFESVLRTYLQFLCSGLLRVAPDKWLSDRSGNGGPPPLSIWRATMGQLVYLVREVGKEIDKSEDARTRELVRELTRGASAPRWIPDKAHALVNSRNMWVHGGGGSTSSVPLASQRLQAEEFAALCASITDALIDGAYPTAILVEEITYDKWGRRRVTARTATLMQEQLFTNENLEPGEVYLMLAHTNPLRIDPLLVRMSTAPKDS